jgi:hypothetical protein
MKVTIITVTGQRSPLLQSQDGHKRYQDIALGVRKYLQKENSLYQDISGPCHGKIYKRGNLLGINFSNRISLEISELQRIFFEKETASHSLGHSSLITT